MHQYRRFALLLLCGLLLTSCLRSLNANQTAVPPVGYEPQPSEGTAQPACIKSFKDFLIPQYRQEADTVLPLSPWQAEAEIPGSPARNPIELIRLHNDQQEIWFKDRYVYNLNLKTWKEVSRSVHGTAGETADVEVDRLFVTRNGDVWGQNKWDAKANDQKRAPLLSRFNEKAQQFQHAPNGLAITPRIEHGMTTWPVVVLDGEDVFWIFDTDGAIYSYDPVKERAKKHPVVIPDSYAIQAVLAPDGEIYYAVCGWNSLV